MPITDARLSAIADMLPRVSVIADIGADHGRLGARLLLDDACRTVWFTDISEPSLLKARALIAKLGLEARAEFYVGDGARALPAPPDAAVIAGMGGETIARILEGANGALGNARVVVEPNVGVARLRARAALAGYEIVREKLARANGRWYVLIALARGNAVYTREQLILGPELMRNPDEDLRAYARFRQRVLQKALAGARKSGRAETLETEEELALWTKIAN